MNDFVTIAGLPLYFLKCAFGVLFAAATEPSSLLFLAGSVLAGLTAGWLAVAICLCVWGLLIGLSEMLGAHTKQVNFLARVIRDNS